MRVGGLIAGVAGLALLDVVSSSAAATERTAAIPTLAASAVRRLLAPDVALLPNFRDSGGGAPLWHDAGGGTTNTTPGSTVRSGNRRPVRTAPTSTSGVVGPGI